jgi:hypothetical protein
MELLNKFELVMKKVLIIILILVNVVISAVSAQKLLDFEVYTKEGKTITGKFEEAHDLYPFLNFEYSDSIGKRQKIPATRALYARVGNLKFETRMGYSDYFNLIMVDGQIRVLYRVQMLDAKDTLLTIQNLIIDQPDILKAIYTIAKREDLENLFIEYPELYARYKFKRNTGAIDDIIEFNRYIDRRKD